MEMSLSGGCPQPIAGFCEGNRSSEARLADAEPRRAAHRSGLLENNAVLMLDRHVFHVAVHLGV